ncbi:hypothetical protein CEXT_794601 [Caerostris extrusa]|uniref:Uncharacterized protein n=1 Tax=Caerostris extrusa TaxID=172846 RepID=A0AAV4Y1H2_CAEEX|nr:hypothetical protein CEXT_794601 [Caerostris extrusa]
MEALMRAHTSAPSWTRRGAAWLCDDHHFSLSFDKSKKPDPIHHFIQVPRTESPYPRIFPPATIRGHLLFPKNTKTTSQVLY